MVLGDEGGRRMVTLAGKAIWPLFRQFGCPGGRWVVMLNSRGYLAFE